MPDHCKLAPLEKENESAATKRGSCSKRIKDTKMSIDEDRVLVVGAGAAGLAAADVLARAGVPVVLLEARNRIGGRIYTHYDELSPVAIELGAEFVHGKPPALINIIERARLLFSDATERHWYFENGSLNRSADFWSAVIRLMDQMKSTDRDRSFADFLSLLPSDEANTRSKRMAARYVQGFHAAAIDRIGVHGLIKANEAAAEVEGDNSFRVLDGYVRVAEYLRQEAERAGASVHLDTPIDRIDWTRNQVRAISGARQMTFDGTRVVITLPIGVLQANSGPGALEFSPTLPRSQSEAIDHLAMGQVLKIVLRFRRRFWEELDFAEDIDSSELGFVHFPEAVIPTWWTQIPVRAPILVGWVGGDASTSLLDLSQDRILDGAVASLSQVFALSAGFLRSELEAFYVHDWHQDPYARGGYAYLPVDGIALQLQLSEPVDNTLYFAGEATTVGHIGTVHGAIQSGLRVAHEILQN